MLREGDGGQHVARGHFTELTPCQCLAFDLAPQGEGGTLGLHVSHVVRLESAGNRTVVSLRSRAAATDESAAPLLAGLRIGWEQTLDKLAALLAPDVRAKPLASEGDRSL